MCLIQNVIMVKLILFTLFIVADIKHIDRATLLDTKNIYKYLHLEKRLSSV